METRLFAAWLAVLALIGCDSGEPGRRILTDRWDTVAIIAPESVDDTTLLYVSQLMEWNGDYAVRDHKNLNLRYVSRNGELIWAFGRVGGGPGEIQTLQGIWTGPNGLLWALDYNGAKILGFDEHGQVVRERSLLHLPVIPSALGFLGRHLIATTHIPDPFLMVLDTGTLALEKAMSFPAQDSLSTAWNFHAKIATGEDILVVAMGYGPGFVVLRGDEIRFHPYIEHIPWALKSGPRVRARGADSARYGATSAAVDNGLIYMLSGGRPIRQAHPAEPTTLIDVYETDGSYLHSFRLPSHFSKMTRSDDDFVLFNESEEGFPQIFRLHPKGH